VGRKWWRSNSFVYLQQPIKGVMIPFYSLEGWTALLPSDCVRRKSIDPFMLLFGKRKWEPAINPNQDPAIRLMWWDLIVFAIHSIHSQRWKARPKRISRQEQVAYIHSIQH
jgi:hypothetical protein